LDLDGFTKEVYERIRVGGDFDLQIKTIEAIACYVNEKELNTRLELIYNLYYGLNDCDLEAFVAWCEESNFEYKVIEMHQWGGSRDDINSHYEGSKRTSPCPCAWNSSMILWTGEMSLCYFDGNAEEICGDVNKQTIKEIWQTTIRGHRQAQVNGIFKGVCGKCTDFTDSQMPKFKSTLYPEMLRTEEKK